MDKWTMFQRFLVTENSQISVVDFVINAVIVFILSLILEFSYAKCAKSLSGRRMFAANFFLIAFTTMLIISIVKSSLALSLGLVGALSIVRFRSAIKEPEELAYLFFVISMGLGLGANQRIITLVAFGILLAIIWVRYFFSKKEKKQNLFLSISHSGDGKPSMEKVKELVNKNFVASHLSRYDESNTMIDVSYWVEVRDTGSLENFKNELLEKAPGTHVSFVDNKAF